MFNQQDKHQKKALQNIKPFQDLYLRFSFNRQQPQIIPYPIFSDIFNDKSSNVLKIKVDTVLKIASSLIVKKKIKLTKFMNIFVEIDHKLVNVFKLKKGIFAQPDGNVVKLKREDQCFYLNVWIFDLQKMQKTNPLLELTAQNAKYQKVMQRLEKISEVFTKQLQNLNDEQKSSYDIAYFFAQPLVEPQKLQDFPRKIQIYENLKLDKYRASGSDVSFQKEYDKFINMIKGENFFANITIEMMVATQNNIRQLLSERCNILHFSCHGQVDFLRIQKDRNVGYLDALTSARLIKLLDGKALPKIIIFNACFSRKIASDIHQRFPQITTIGYEGQAKDNYCQILTQKLYEGIYKRREPFFKIFQQVKSQITSKNQEQAKKLYIFKASTQFKFDKADFPVNQNYNINWGYFQNLGQKQPIGIKQKLFEFIRNYLFNSQKTKFFVVGEPQSGKSIFIRKALYYTMHRCVFRQKLQIDLRKGEKPIVNMLELKLQYKKQIYNFIKQNKNTNIIVVVDHCNDLIRNDPEEFMKFFKKIEREIKLGKLILISDNISYFMEINILIDENVYEYEEVLPAKEPKIHDDYNTYMKRWHPNLDKNWNEFLQHRIKEWFEALRASDSKEAFVENLQKIKQKDKIKQGQKLMVNLQLEFESFRDKIVRTQRKVKAYLTSGYYSRTQDCFILLNIFPQFSKPTQKQETLQIIKLQRRQKHSYIQDLITCYEDDIKSLIKDIIEALGKFHTQRYDRRWWENQLLFATQKLFVIVGLTVLIKDSKEGEKQVKEQLFNAYTFITKLFNRYQKLLSELPRLMTQCQALKLKIYMAIYSFYKHHEHLRVAKEKALNSDKQHKPKSEISSINAEASFTINFLQTIPVVDPFKDSLKENNIIGDSGNNSEFGFGISQRDSLTNNYGNKDRRDSLRSQNDFSSMRPSIYPNNQLSQERQTQQKKQSLFRDFQNELREQYVQSQYWQLIQKVTQLDTIIRTIQTQQSRQLVLDPTSMTYTSSVFEFSSSQNQRVFEIYYHQVQKFYRLHNQITILYERFQSFNEFEDSHDVDFYRIKKVFFGEVQLDLCYLQGLKLIAKLFEVVDDEYFFDYEVWYREKLKNIREKLIRTQKILDYSIARKLNHNRDLSYKKVYKEYLELYIDLRFKLQKLYSSLTPNGQKQLLGIFNKLLKLSDDARSIQLKNRIQEFVEKNFYNKCSVLISQPIGYIPKHKNFTFVHQKDTKKSKGTIKKQSSHDAEKILFYPLNIYRASDLIMNDIKNGTQKKVVSQIHIETEILNFDRLNSYQIQKVQEDSRKKRLIYLIMCDCARSSNHQTFFIQNQYGESIKKYFKLPNFNGFPYAPVIILYGSNADLLESYYRQYAQFIHKKIAIIMLPTSSKLPEIQCENTKDLFKYVWNDYLQKHIGVTFLSSFWTKFCQIYFDQEHSSFRNQVIRSFNIAKQQSLILLKKKYLQGLNASQIQKQIDNIVGRLSLRIQNRYETDEAVNLENNFKFVQEKDSQPNQNIYNQSREDEFLRTSTMHESVRRQDQILTLNNREIGCNYQIHQFMKVFFQNVQQFQKDRQFTKNFIQYHAQINETNLISFAKAIYHKLIRMSNRFEAGIDFKNMEGYKLDNSSELFNVFDDNLVSSALIGSTGIGDGLQIKEEDSVDYLSNGSSVEVPLKKQKKVQIYYNIAYKDLKPLIQGFKTRDQPLLMNNMGFTYHHVNKPSLTTIFRILIVDTSFIDPDMKYYLQSTHSCRINNHQIRPCYLQNIYHACDAILHYSKRVEGFNFIKVIDDLYNKKNPPQSLKQLLPRQVKDKIVEYFEKHYP